MLTEKAYEEAINVVKRCSTPKGMYASGTDKGYTSVWARDSMITLIGASLTGKFKDQFKLSLNTLTKHQDKLGQIPNNVDLFDKKRKSKVYFATIDSSLWYIIGNYIYAKRYKDKFLLRKNKKSIEKTFLWLLYQDTGKDGMPEQHPTSDWQDAAPHKYGHTVNTQALYYAALKLARKEKQAVELKKTANRELYNDKMGFYLPYRWKDHKKYIETSSWFDSLGNMLAVIFQLANKNQSENILNYVFKKGINKPYLMKNLYPPIKPGDPDWHDYFWANNTGKPTHYLNGGIWPFNGGFFVTALALANRKKQAEEQLIQLAKTNQLGNSKEWEFNEWLDWNGKPRGKVYQAWSAGAYIMAYHAVKNKDKIFKY